MVRSIDTNDVLYKDFRALGDMCDAKEISVVEANKIIDYSGLDKLEIKRFPDNMTVVTGMGSEGREFLLFSDTIVESNKVKVLEDKIVFED